MCIFKKYKIPKSSIDDFKKTLVKKDQVIKELNSQMNEVNSQLHNFFNCFNQAQAKLTPVINKDKPISFFDIIENSNWSLQCKNKIKSLFTEYVNW